MSGDVSTTETEIQGTSAAASDTTPSPGQDALDSERHLETPDLEKSGSESLAAETDERPADSDHPSPDERPNEEASKREAAKEDETVDEAVESQIAEFEETLAMPCPICGAGKIHEKTTAKGKIFYQCSSKDCMFIHWGKPYHIPCALCSNPFLVEVTNRTGKIVLKCPRAACRHQQRLPGAADVPSRTRPTPAVKKAQGAQGKTQRQGKRKVRKVLVRKKRKAG
jgi:ssDNA-binding Zn-finger/Zn-ribbon topoisomerase 1